MVYSVIFWSLPVVVETYDGGLNDINGFHVKKEHVFAALDNAKPGPVAEGNVGGMGGNTSGDIFIAFSIANPGAANRRTKVKLEMLPRWRTQHDRRSLEKRFGAELCPKGVIENSTRHYIDPVFDKTMASRRPGKKSLFTTLTPAAQTKARTPPHKSLFNAVPYCGLPIGNLTSQFFANVYLNALDQFVKYELKCRYYLRYVDDAVLLDADVRKLMLWKHAIADFVWQELWHELNEKATQIAPVAGGVDFAGFIIRHNYKLVRRRVVGNLKEKLKKIEGELICKRDDCTIYRFHDETLTRCQAMVNSYWGISSTPKRTG